MKLNHSSEVKKMETLYGSKLLQQSKDHSKELSLLALRTSPGERPFVDVEAHEQLISQLVSLKNEMKLLKSSFVEERRDMKVDFSSKMLAQERAFRSELQEHRDRARTGEDEAVALAELLQSAQAKVATLSVTCQQLEEGRREDHATQTRLRSDLKALQLSVASAYRGEAREDETGVRLSEAHAEAKSRQLSNMVEFLKAQLAAEQQAGRDAGTLLDDSRRLISGLQEELRSRSKENDMLVAGAVEDAERRMEARLLDQANDLSGARARLALAQTQLQEAQVEVTVARQREEATRSSGLKMQAQLALARQESERLGALLMETRALKEPTSGGADDSRTSHEAALRRLDNEKQYLKNQLASEITLKSEMQAALVLCQQQLSEAQVQWRGDVEELREGGAEVKRLAVEREYGLQATAALALADAEQLQLQNTDLRGALGRLRDQVRVEQLANENAKMVHKRLLDELDESRGEVIRLAQGGDALASQHAHELEAQRRAAEQRVCESDLEANLLRASVSRLHAAVSEAKSEALDAKDGLLLERSTQLRLRATVSIFESLCRLRQRRIQQAFRLWSSNSVLVEVAKQFRVHLEDKVCATLENAEQDKLLALDAVRAAQQGVHEEEIAQLRLELGVESRRLRVALEADREEALCALGKEFDAILMDRELAHKDELNALQENAKGTHASLLEQKEDELRRATFDLEAQLQAERDQALTDADLARLGERILRDEEWSARLQEKEAEQVVAMEIALQSQAAEFEGIRRALDIVREESVVAMAAQCALEEKTRTEELSIKFQSVLARRNSEWEEVMRVQIAEIKTASELRLEEQRLENSISADRAVLELRETLADEAYDSQNARDRDWRDKLLRQEEATSRSFDAEKQRCLSLEASKWQQTLRDAEAAFHLEAVRLRREGWTERDSEARRELEEVRVHAADTRAEVERMGLRRLDEALSSQREMLDDQEARFEGERDVFRKQVAAAEAKVRATEEAHDELQSYIRTKEAEMHELRVESEGMRVSFETVSRAVADKDKRIRLYAKRLQDEVEAERGAAELRVREAVAAADKVAVLHWTERLANREVELLREHEERMVLLKNEAEARTDEITKRFEKMNAKLKEEVAAKIKQTLVEVNQRNRDERDRALGDVLANHESVLTSLRDEQLAALDEIRRRQHEAAELRIRELRELWEDEQFDADKVKERDFQQHTGQLLLQAAAIAETEKLKSLKLEASKWQMLLNESESRIQMAMEVARLGGWEERDKTAQEEVRTLKQRLELASRRSVDVKGELEEQAVLFRNKLDTQAAAHQRELTEKLDSSLLMERTRSDEVWGERLRLAEEAYRAHEGALKAKLQMEAETLDRLKSDFSAQMSRLAQERSDLLELANQKDLEIGHMREAFSSEKADQTMLAENESLLRDMQVQRVHKLVLQELHLKHERAMEESEAKWDHIADNRVKAEALALSVERDIAMAALKAQHNVEVEMLHSNIENLHSDIADKMSGLQLLTKRLEEAEDHLYDAQQKMRSQAVASSFAQWTSVTNGLRLRARMESKLAQVEKDLSDRAVRVQAEHTANLAETTLAALLLADLLQRTESSRKKTYSAVTSHNTEILVERRSQMRQSEKEMQRLGNERATLELDYERIEEEVAALSGQVGDLEEQIHEHNRSSAMQNGRINVAHVRKKRRLDNELEKLLELIEIKRGELLAMDERVTAKGRQRDDKELSLIELQQDVVKVLVDQQRLVLGVVEADREVGELCRRLLDDSGLPWPPPPMVTIDNALSYRQTPRRLLTLNDKL
jgi:hypothetical protein